MAQPPLPPAELANRAGELVGADASYDAYVAVGKALRDTVLDSLPSGWEWPGKRVLDFGCGAGRVLRHFTTEARHAEFWGCDIDEASIAWLTANLSPPVRAFVNGERPPLPQPDGSFDLIYAFSVFSHITEQWSAWLLELHRLLAPDGRLIASFLGEGMSQHVAGEPWVEERIGMNVLMAEQGWDRGGPTVLLSPWWIREHWGRAFEIVELRPGSAPGTQGLVVARPKRSRPSRAELEHIDRGEPRELLALQHNVQQLQREAIAARADAARVIAAYEASRSWRLTAPLRRLAALVRLRSGSEHKR